MLCGVRSKTILLRFLILGPFPKYYFHSPYYFLRCSFHMWQIGHVLLGSGSGIILTDDSSRMTYQETPGAEEKGGGTGSELTNIPVSTFTSMVIFVLIKKVYCLSLTRKPAPLVHMPILRSQGLVSHSAQLGT